MRYRLTRIGVFQTAAMGGATYALLGLLVVPIFYLMTKVAPFPPETPVPFSGAFLLFLPVLYGVAGFLFTAVGAAVYNLVARRIGGIEVEVAPAASMAPPAVPGAP